MRIVSWNMGCAPPMARKYRRRHAEAWRYLLHELDPDVALVQEALFIEAPPADFGQVFWSKNRGLDSGSAVVVRKDVSAANVEIESIGSYVAGAELSMLGHSVIVASAHVGPSNYRKHLRALVESICAATATRRFVFGGDLNAARHVDDVYGGRWYRRFFSDLEARAFHDCHWVQHEREVQSFWGRQARNAYQCDHLFTDMATAEAVTDCRIVDDDVVRGLSDHGPMVLDLAATAGKS